MIVAEGSCSGIEVIFIASARDERVVLLINILQSEQRLSFPIDSVHKIQRYACLRHGFGQ